MSAPERAGTDEKGLQPDEQVLQIDDSDYGLLAILTGGFRPLIRCSIFQWLRYTDFRNAGL